MEINKRKELIISAAKFFSPFLVAFLGLLLIYITIDKEISGKLFFLMFTYFIPPLGKESVIPIGVFGGELDVPLINKHVVVPPIDPFIMAISIAFVDIVVALFLVWNYDLAKKIPLLGEFMKKVENIGRSSSEKYTWVRALRFFGLVLFVMIPFQGSGGVVGSILGRLIGMKPWVTFLAISIGAIVGCLLIAYFSEIILGVFVKNFLLGLLIAIFVLILFTIVLVFRRLKKQQK